jgi:hypothetical protein
MHGPPSSRTVDPRLSAASGVMRDTLGAIHNLQHLLGSVKVGPKALARVIPDVHASCVPMIAAARDLVLGASHSLSSATSIKALGELVTSRMEELERTLAGASGQLRASDRLKLEVAVAAGVRDLDGALELVELLVEASATGSVPVDVTDVIRESAVRPDTGSGRGHRVKVTWVNPAAPTSVRVNPRLALRLVAFAAALAGHRDAGVHVSVTTVSGGCQLLFASPSGAGDTMLVAVPPLIALSERCVVEVARAAAETTIALFSGDRGSSILFPLAPAD